MITNDFFTKLSHVPEYQLHFCNLLFPNVHRQPIPKPLLREFYYDFNGEITAWVLQVAVYIAGGRECLVPKRLYLLGRDGDSDFQVFSWSASG